MKTVFIVFLTTLLAFSVVNAAEPDCQVYSQKHNHCWFNDKTDFDIDDGIIIISHDDHAVVEITEDGKLFVHGRSVEVDKEQAELLREYYDHLMEITEYAEEMGLKGAKLGAGGAKIGALAVANLVKLMSPYYDTDDLEEELEREAELLEEEAELLEERAEELGDLAGELEKMHEELKQHISELDELDWF